MDRVEEFDAEIEALRRENKRVRALLKASEEGLDDGGQSCRKLLNNAPFGFALCEIIFNSCGEPVDFRYREVNYAFGRLTGLDAEQIVGKTVLEVLPETEPYWFEWYERVARTGGPTTFCVYHPELGKHFEVAIFSAKRGQLAAIFNDITDRVQVEQALRADEERFRTLCHCAPVGIFMTDPDLLLTYCNPRLAAITGRGVEDLPGESWLQIVHPEDRDKVRKCWQTQCDDGRCRPFSVEHRLRNREGEIRRVRVLLTPANGNREGSGYIGTVEEIM